MPEVIECVVNISEGKNHLALSKLQQACESSLLDVHSDIDHNRSVFTLAHENSAELESAVQHLSKAAISLLDIRTHSGEHPRIGIVDVVPFVALPNSGSHLEDAIVHRNHFARWMAKQMNVPCFLYEPERTLPFVRKHAFVDLSPDFGPTSSHPTAGACAVGARNLLVAYNLWLKTADVDEAKRIAQEIRDNGIRAIGLKMNDFAQVSCNLIDPMNTGPDAAYDLVAQRAEIQRAELVGLIPERLLRKIDSNRWQELDLSPDRTIEYRLRAKNS